MFENLICFFSYCIYLFYFDIILLNGEEQYVDRVTEAQTKPGSFKALSLINVWICYCGVWAMRDGFLQNHSPKYRPMGFHILRLRHQFQLQILLFNF